MSWTLRDTQKAHPAPEERRPPAPVTDDQPLPSYLASMPTEGDDDLPPGWLDGALKEQGMMTARELDAFSWLMRRGVESRYDDHAPAPYRPGGPYGQ